MFGILLTVVNLPLNDVHVSRPSKTITEPSTIMIKHLNMKKKRTRVSEQQERILCVQLKIRIMRQNHGVDLVNVKKVSHDKTFNPQTTRTKSTLCTEKVVTV